MHLQIREDIFLIFGADGSVDFLCGDTLSIDAPRMTIGLEEDSYIYTDSILHGGHPGVAMKKVTLDEDDVREYVPGATEGVLSAATSSLVVGLSTRQFIERVATRYVAEQLSAIFTAAPVAPGDGGTVLKGAVAAALQGLRVTIPNPPSNSVIGKTDASAEHLKGN